MSELVEKQVVIDWLKYKWNRNADSLFYGIQGLPSAQPEQKTGEWQTHYDVLTRTVEVRCSFCHAKSNIDSDLLMDDGTRVELFKYCPCCGARMDGEKNE